MRTVKDIKVNAFVFVYRSQTYPPRLRWEHLSVHRTLFGFILWNENISNASSLITRMRSSSGGSLSTGEGWHRYTGIDTKIEVIMSSPPKCKFYKINKADVAPHGPKSMYCFMIYHAA